MAAQLSCGLREFRVSCLLGWATEFPMSSSGNLFTVMFVLGEL